VVTGLVGVWPGKLGWLDRFEVNENTGGIVLGAAEGTQDE
jgi:hypothetical protein